MNESTRANECEPIGGLSERPMELVLKTSGQQCPVGSNPTPSAQANSNRTEGSAAEWNQISIAP